MRRHERISCVLLLIALPPRAGGFALAPNNSARRQRPAFAAPASSLRDGAVMATPFRTGGRGRGGGRSGNAKEDTPLFSTATATLPEGLSKTVSKSGNGPPINVGDVATVRYSCYLPNAPGTPFAKSSAQKVVVGDGLMIDGWEMALQSMRGGERSVVRVSDPRFGYGSAGVPPFVPPDAEIEMDVEVLEVEAGVDLGTIASADPLKPRTPASIAAAYNTRREQSALEEADEKEGLDGLIAKFNSFYFFGFFESETGEKAPWYLRPSITFPIAFAIVGAAFWVSFSFGGISERGAQVTDELDEILVSGVGVGAGALLRQGATLVAAASIGSTIGS